MSLTRRRPMVSGVRFAGVAMLLGAASPLTAAPLDYNYLQASWLRVSPDLAHAEDADGYEARLSAPLEPGSFLRVSYSRYKNDASNAEVSALSGGIGMFSRIAEHADIYGLVSYETLDRKVVDKDSGYAIELGLRWATSSRLELDAGARYLNLDDSPDEVIWFGGLAVQLSPAIALTAQYSQGDDDRRYTAGLRFFSTE
ncbi:hypothetical protein [Oceanococcus atlanticus]|nr:hypothetical protein [Oceanococcus atlanticus]